MIPDYDSTLPIQLYRTLDVIMPAYRAIFSRYDLTDRQWRVLRFLWQEGKTTVVSLASNTMILAPSLVGVLDRLEKRGLVSRVRSKNDRREVHVMVTAKGRELQVEVAPLVSDLHDTIKNHITDEEWQTLTKILAKLGDFQSDKATMTEHKGTI
jgi:homoprotocatechuate degradation regulator HpaR